MAQLYTLGAILVGICLFTPLVAGQLSWNAFPQQYYPKYSYYSQYPYYPQPIPTTPSPTTPASPAGGDILAQLDSILKSPQLTALLNQIPQTVSSLSARQMTLLAEQSAMVTAFLRQHPGLAAYLNSNEVMQLKNELMSQLPQVLLQLTAYLKNMPPMSSMIGQLPPSIANILMSMTPPAAAQTIPGKPLSWGA